MRTTFLGTGSGPRSFVPSLRITRYPASLPRSSGRLNKRFVGQTLDHQALATRLRTQGCASMASTCSKLPLIARRYRLHRSRLHRLPSVGRTKLHVHIDRHSVGFALRVEDTVELAMAYSRHPRGPYGQTTPLDPRLLASRLGQNRSILELSQQSFRRADPTHLSGKRRSIEPLEFRGLF